MTANAIGSRIQVNLRIISALASRDILDAIKNRTVLAVLIPAMLMVVLYRFLPDYEVMNEQFRVAVVDQGSSRLIEELSEHDQFRVREMPSAEAMQSYLAGRDVKEMGLILPMDFDNLLESGNAINLQGYVVSWADAKQIQEIRRFFEEQLSQWAGVPITIDTVGNQVYALKDSSGYPFLASIALVFVICMIGVSVVPHIMIDEKVSKTLDAVLVSPATASHVVAGKAITGLFYCMVAAILSLILNQVLVLHWWLAILVAVCGSLFTISIGLLLGALIETRQNFTFWGFFFFIPLLLPVFLSIMDDLLPERFVNFLSWIPTVALSKAFRVSFSQSPMPEQVLPELLILVGSALVFFSLVVWVIYRQNRG